MKLKPVYFIRQPEPILHWNGLATVVRLGFPVSECVQVYNGMHTDPKLVPNIATPAQNEMGWSSSFKG